ncbi:MAG: TolC family protein, partial [Planctomycetota bacterium]
ALVSAACDAYQREKYAPFIPSVLLGFSTGGFGGGLGSQLANVDGRYDFDAAMTWQVRNLGLGESSARQQRSAQVQQAKFEKLRVLDNVAADVSEAFAQTSARRQQINATQRAIATAADSHRRNVERIRDGQGIPLEALQSALALEQASLAYLDAVTAFNQSQLRLQWALGWPVNQLDSTQ